MGLNFKYTIIGTALALSVTALLACGGSAPAPQPAPTAPTATQAPAATATTAPVVARVDTPAPPSLPQFRPPVQRQRLSLWNRRKLPTAPTAEPRAEQPTQQPADTPTSTATAASESTPQPTVTPVPPTATAVPTSTPEPTAAPSLQVGTNVSDLAPGFTLPSARSGEYALESFRGDKNVVLVFYRAFW